MPIDYFIHPVAPAGLPSRMRVVIYFATADIGGTGHLRFTS